MGEINDNKLGDNDLDAISGGRVTLDLPKIKINCVECGKEIEVIDDRRMPMSMIGSELARHNYYRERCKECALSKPYWKDKVVNNEIVRNGRIIELLAEADYKRYTGENAKG